MNNAKDYDWDDPDLLIEDNASNPESDAQSLTSMVYLNSIIYNQELDQLLARENFDKVNRGLRITLVWKLHSKIGEERFYNCYYFYWTVGSPDSNNASERMAYWMSDNLPEDPHKLKSPTKDLIEMWLSHKIFVLQVAQFFTDNREEELATELEKKLIDRMEYNMVCAYGKLWRNLWDLIQERWSVLSRYLKQYFNCPFTTSEQLFQEIIATHFNNCFDEYSQSYYKQNYKEIKQFALLRRKKYNDLGILDESEIKDFNSLGKKYLIKNSWLDNLIQVLSFIIQETDDEIVETYVKIHNSCSTDIDKLFIKASRGSKNQKVFTTTWIEGCEYQGTFYKSAGGEIRQARRPRGLGFNK